MRIMAIDYGDARTGIAISDATGLLAGFTTVIHSRKSDVVVEEIQKGNTQIVDEAVELIKKLK